MMKLVAGLGSIDDYVAYVKAGADEVFIGYVPEEWQLRDGYFHPLNRREVCFYNVQIGSRSELEILSDLVEAYKVPVTIAFNSLHYEETRFPMIADIMRDCLSLGFSSVIIGDLALLVYLSQIGLTKELKIHISGEMGEINSYLVSEYERLGMSRLIFHRYVSTNQMQTIIQKASVNCGLDEKEYEAFLLNEKCPFEGAYCNSLHCDEMPPMCRMIEASNMEDDEINSSHQTGESGCGLCALWDMKAAGITHLKIVGRGAYVDEVIESIKAAKRARDMVEKLDSKEEYISQMKEEIFSDACSGNCYYKES